MDDLTGEFRRQPERKHTTRDGLHQGDALNEDAVKDYPRHRRGGTQHERMITTKGGPVAKKNESTSQPDGPRLLAGGNPKIPKGDGDAPVQAYIDAMPGWKSDVGRHLDELIAQAVPHVVKAVKWNQPLYGVEDQGFFVSFRCFTNYVKVTFFRGADLDPVPPVDFKHPNEKAFHIHEDDDLDEEQLTSWFEQAAAIPGWTP